MRSDVLVKMELLDNKHGKFSAFCVLYVYVDVYVCSMYSTCIYVSGNLFRRTATFMKALYKKHCYFYSYTILLLLI